MCKKCDYKFYYKSALKRHIESYHEERNILVAMYKYNIYLVAHLVTVIKGINVH